MNTTTRKVPLLGIGLVILSTIIFYGNLVRSGLSASFGGNNNDFVTAIIQQKIFIIFIVISLVFLLSFVFLSVRPKNGAKYVLGVYIFFLLIMLGISVIIPRSVVGTETGCSLISNYYPQGNYCYMNLAKARNDISLCKNAKLNECNGYFARQAKDPSLCLSTDPYCVEDIAQTKKDSKICNLIQDVNVKQRCLVGIGQVTSNSSVAALACDVPDSTRPKEVCVMRVATTLNDPSYCGKAGDWSEQCYTTIAVATKNGSLCEKVKFPQNCYRTLAEATKDKIYCDKMEDTYFRDGLTIDNRPVKNACYATVAAAKK